MFTWVSGVECGRVARVLATSSTKGYEELSCVGGRFVVTFMLPSLSCTFSTLRPVVSTGAVRVRRNERRTTCITGLGGTIRGCPR